MYKKLLEIQNQLKGDLFTDKKTRLLYATDASAYREIPLAVALPKDKDDIRELIRFAGKTGNALIPRTAGTSLAGQVVVFVAAGGVVRFPGVPLGRIAADDDQRIEKEGGTLLAVDGVVPVGVEGVGETVMVLAVGGERENVGGDF